MSTTRLERKPPPDTPEEFLDMVRDHHEGKRVLRPRHCKNQEACAKIKKCDRVIAAIGTLDEPGYQERVPLRLGGHHALRLCDEIKGSMEVGKEGFSSKQREASDTFQALLEDTSDNALLERLDRDDAREVKKREMKELIKIFSTIFFPTKWSDNEMELDFKWEDWSDQPEMIGEYYGREYRQPRIEMCAFNHDEKPSHGDLTGLAMDRLVTILHELVHAYLEQYACRCVPNPTSFEEDVDQLDGHGRAWQRIASSVERAAPDLVGLPINLDSFNSILANWDELVHWPTEKEVKDWKLSSHET